MSQKPELLDWVKGYLNDNDDARSTGCWAITEPNHCSDRLMWQGENSANSYTLATQTISIVDGYYYIINGQKSSRVNTGAIASGAALFVTFERSESMDKCVIAIVPQLCRAFSVAKRLIRSSSSCSNRVHHSSIMLKFPRNISLLLASNCTKWSPKQHWRWLVLEWGLVY